MIVVLFHVIYLLGKLVLHRYVNRGRSVDSRAISRRLDNDNNDDDDEDPFVDVSAYSKTMKDQANNELCSSSPQIPESCYYLPIRFQPPAYIQRYNAVIDALNEYNSKGCIKKVVDFGCAELKMCVYLKKIHSVEEILFVDVDRSTLELYEAKAKPLHVDYLHRRNNPLLIRIMEGSVTAPDKLLENCDAVICIELVEHLYPEPFTMMPFNIFGYIKPKVAFITTPNADFNVLFRGLKGFRHADHKFEWTRKQFEDWAHNIILRFPEYEVKFEGICEGPEGTEHLGACTQMAIFRKIYDLKSEVPGRAGIFNTVNTYEYPYEIDNRSDEEKILHDAVYLINRFSLNAEDLSEEVSLQKILSSMSNYYISVDDLKEILENANWTVINREAGPVVVVPSESFFSDHSLIEEDFLDNDLGIDDSDEEPGPPNEYFERGLDLDTNVVDIEDWDNEPHIISESENRGEETASPDAEAVTANSTASIYPNDICLDDITTESRSTEFLNSANNGSSILISSYSETKDSENSETGQESSLAETTSTCVDNKIADITATSFSHVEEENKSKNSATLSADLTIGKNNSMCSIFLEPSQISNDEPLEDLSFLESTITSLTEKKKNKKLKLNNSTSLHNLNDNNFDEPQYASSPYILSSVVTKKRKITEGTEVSNTSSTNTSNENLILCRSESPKDLLKHNSDLSSSSNESVIAESNPSECLPTTSSESPENLRQYTGTIPKNFSLKLSVTEVNEEVTKLYSESSDTPISPPNSWSPEVMDSGYPNSNSPPDLSPEYDLSSIVYNYSDSESPSMADAPRGLPELPAENRDLANNNLDDEGNYMGPEENRQMNDLHPLINVLENDIENENDIFLMRDGFPVWLLRILRRPDENFGE